MNFYEILISLLYFISSLFYGSVFFIKLFKSKYIEDKEYIVFSALLGVLINTLLSYYLSHFLPIKLSTIRVFVVSLVVYFIFSQKVKFKISLPRKYILFNIFWIICFSLVISQTHLKPDKFNFNGSPSTSGDLPFHMGLISNFVYGDNFPPVNPIAPFKTINYHFVADLVSAQFLSLGITLRSALIIPSVVFGLMLVNLIYFLAFKITKNSRASYISVLLFLFNGGLGFIKPMVDKLPVTSYVDASIRFSYLPQLGIGYAGIFAEMLMAQRALLIGIPLWALAVYMMLLLLNNKNDSKIFIVSALVYGLLPFANIYAFIAFSCSFIFIVVLEIIKNKKQKYKELVYWVKYCFYVFLVSSPLIIPILFSHSGQEGFMRFSFMEWPPVEGIYKKIFFNITNFGLPFLIGIVLSITFIFKKIFKNQSLLFLNVFIIFISNFIIFQPYVWDNSRFILYPYIMISILAGYVISKFIGNKSFLIKTVGLIFFVSSIITGVLISINDPRMLGGLFNKNDLTVAKEIRNFSKPDEIFLTARNHNNIISSLAGRKIFLGFGGYLWTHGIKDTEDRESTIYTIYEANNGYKELIKKYNISYIYIGDWERSEYSINEKILRQNYPLIYEKNRILIFKTTN